MSTESSEQTIIKLLPVNISAEEFDAVARALGYVKLAGDQTLPLSPLVILFSELGVYKQAQQDMLEVQNGEVWKKVKVQK